LEAVQVDRTRTRRYADWKRNEYFGSATLFDVSSTRDLRERWPEADFIDRDTYEPNLPVTVANAEEAASFDDAVIDRTLEPTIIADGQMIAMGKVLLKKRA
jgi:hypothetical protein